MIIVQVVLCLCWFTGAVFEWRPAFYAFWLLAVLQSAIWVSSCSAGWRRVCLVIIMSGTILNAAVILTNGGMPVPGVTGPLPIWWVPMHDGQHLLWLADVYAGFSIGDMFLIGGGLGWIVQTVVETVRASDGR